MLMPDNQARLMHALRRVDDTAAKLDLLAQARVCLIREGHTVLEGTFGPGRPSIRLAASALLARMAETGRGAYYMRGVDADGHSYRKGVLVDYRNVHVTWIEWVN